MAKYDDFDLDIRNDNPVEPEYIPTTSDLLCAYTLSVCVDLTVSIIASECCNKTAACGTPSQGCTGQCDKTVSACQSYCGSGCRR